jgi:ubiquinone/menaquinone biosynthesis C-methylase UbiE
MKNLIKLLSFNTFIPFFYPALMLPLRPFRKKAIAKLHFEPGDKVLVPGVGTGHDLPFIPKDADVTGIDISDVMLGIGSAKLKIFRRNGHTEFLKMDAEELRFDNATFDKAILSLFLTVVFDPDKAFAEVVRVVKPGGEILIYDHLMRKGDMPDKVVKPIESIMRYGFTSVTRSLDDIIEGQPVEVKESFTGDAVGFVKGFLLVRK